MKKILVTTALILSVPILYGQLPDAQKLIDIFSIPAAKFDDWAAKKKFYFTFNTKNEDTLIRHYDFKSVVKKGKLVDSIERSIQCKENEKDFNLVYQTASEPEFSALIQQLKAMGFYCNMEGEAAKDRLLYQHKDFIAKTYTEIKDSTTFYSLQFHEQDFPDPAEIMYADDLLCFTSHEYLVHYFGEENVKKDYYFFSGNELANCSVLFVNTSRQVVFIWRDEVNRRGIDDILFGGQQKLKSAMSGGKYVAESDWRFKSGVHPGMTLYELRILNGDDIKFYGGNSLKSGTVITGNKGKLDFYKEEIILGCVNCTDNNFAKAEVMNADEALADGKILFVLSVVLNADEKADSKPNQPVVSK
ncbi:MAG: hypothetical protein V4685_10480 [Bacteroidota bacterium]